MSGETVPRLDLAPRRKRPLALWNPLDYLVLLCWAFFFPQALRWHVRTFGRGQGLLVVQAVLCTALTVAGAGLGLTLLEVPVEWIGVAVGVAVGAALGATLGVAGGVALGVTFGVAGALSGHLSVVYLGLAVAILWSRVADWILTLPFVLRSETHFGSRAVWLPFPGMQARIERWLQRDWSSGVANVYEIVGYSLQFIPAIAAVNAELDRSDRDELLRRVDVLVRDPPHWDLIRYGSASLNKVLLLPRSPGLRFDTPARCACAGFWLWHAGDAVKAAEAFDHLREFPFGDELASIAQAIADAEKAEDIDDLAAWKDATAWLETLPEERLRPGALETLLSLRRAVAEVVAAWDAGASLSHSAALDRAANLLLGLPLDESCPYPEEPLIRRAAKRWHDIVTGGGEARGEAGGEAGGEAAGEPRREKVFNPFTGYSGLPVIGEAFIGRGAVLSQIEALWATSDPPAVILYGHRRMGKTSILRNLEPPGSLLVYLDMQDSAVLIDHTGQLLFDVAEEIHLRASEADLDAGEPPTEDDYRSLGRGRKALNALLAHLDPQMGERRLVLAIDEFELIEDGIEADRIEDGILKYLRSIHQRHRWLFLIFAGLHQLEEMGQNYRDVFQDQSEHVRVGYLAHDDAIGLITRPHPDFTLEHGPGLAEEIVRLTYGQPYLLQRLCWDLVRRWNERFMKGAEMARVLELADLEPMLDDEFYAATEYYFDGVWTNLTGAERTLLAFMAAREAPWTRSELTGAVGNLDAALGLLAHHDVVDDDAQGVRFASELMRRWVARYRP